MWTIRGQKDPISGYHLLIAAIRSATLRIFYEIRKILNRLIGSAIYIPDNKRIIFLLAIIVSGCDDTSVLENKLETACLSAKITINDQYLWDRYIEDLGRQDDLQQRSAINTRRKYFVEPRPLNGYRFIGEYPNGYVDPIGAHYSIIPVVYNIYKDNIQIAVLHSYMLRHYDIFNTPVVETCFDSGRNSRFQDLKRGR